MSEKSGRGYKRTESWGAIRKLPSGRFQASYVVDGERFTAPNTFDAKTDARSWLAGVRSDIQRGKWRDPRTISAETFGPYAEVWVAQRVSSKGDPLRPRTRAEYTRQLAKGLSEFGSAHLDSITPARVRAWHSKRTKEAGATSAARESALLKAIMATAVEDGVIEGNPVRSTLTRSATGHQYRPPTPDELAVIVGEFGVREPRLRLALLLAAFGGLRLSEWRALRREDITIEGDRVVISVSRQAQRVAKEGSTDGPRTEWIVGPPKSAEGVRMVPLPTAIADDVRDHLAEHVGPFPSDLLFAPSGRGEFLDDSRFNSVWNAAREAANLRVKEGTGWVSVVREHDLRHFALSHYAASGATLAELKARAGHASSRAAMIYQHVVSDRAAELADKMPTLPAVPNRVARIG